MKKQTASSTARRSVALPGDLVAEAQALAPPALRDNFNRLVIVALQEFTANRRKQAFEDAMARMAADPSLRSECIAISQDFLTADDDGLSHD
jgi:hypothetical protein